MPCSVKLCVLAIVPCLMNFCYGYCTAFNEIRLEDQYSAVTMKFNCKILCPVH